MDALPNRLSTWWQSLDDPQRRQASLLAVVCFGYVVHFLVYCLVQPFYIEDAGISYAYAENFVAGEGFATYPGGERVEGFSNPLWTFLIAATAALGVPSFTAAKVFGAVFGVVTLPLAWDIARRARPGRNDDVALLAPLLLAASPQFVLWNSAGLENSLFCVLLAAGIRTLLVELDSEERRLPWSALFFVGLAMTRPEGAAYAVFAGLALVLDAVATRRLAPLLRWLPTFALPFAVYQAWRYTYFAWEFPNTYYAKLALKNTQFQPWSWKSGGWKYINKWFFDHHVIWLLPLLAFSMTGLRGRRRWVGLLGLLWLGVAIGWDGREGFDRIPDWWRPYQADWIKFRVWSIAGWTALAGALTLGRPGWRARGLLWICASFSVFFALYSKGDWMKAHRWFNMVVVTLLPLLALGLGELVDALRVDKSRVPFPGVPRWRLPLPLQDGVPVRMLLLALPAAFWMASEAGFVARFVANPETSVRDIRRRVVYMKAVQDRLDLDFVTLLDVDMGAHMLYSGWEILDIAGLVDVPIARHRDYNMAFMKQYLFEENPPDFAHVHAGWARSSKIPRHKEWKQGYLEIPGYPINATKLHVGNHVKKSLFVHKDAPPPGADAQRFEGGVKLVHARLPSPEVAAGGLAFLDTRWQAGFRRDDFRALVKLTDDSGQEALLAVEPGYGWYGPGSWKATEQVDAKFRLPLPPTLPEGDYRVQVILLDDKTGKPLRHLGPVGAMPSTGASDGDGGDNDDDTTEDSGSLSLDTGLVLKVVSETAAYAAAEADLEATGQAAEQPGADCTALWTGFKDATRHVLQDRSWRDAHEATVRGWVASCLVDRAAAREDRKDTITDLIDARRWHRHLAAVKAANRPLAADLDAEGDAAFAAEKWEEAYTAYHQAVSLDPRRSWSRRKAEDARDRALDITRPGDDPLKRLSREDKKTPKAKPKPKPKPTPKEGADRDAKTPEAKSDGDKAAAPNEGGGAQRVFPLPGSGGEEGVLKALDAYLEEEGEDDASDEAATTTP